ncbi:MAG: DUF3144 domain-containing protein [Sulfurovum sp.]|nr:DUF3144 domain-containing protein [Sulfurovum sp.]
MSKTDETIPEKQAETVQTDEKFFERVDTLIAITNGYIKKEVHPTFASNSFMFAASRFNAWMVAAGSKDAEEFANEKEKILEYFTDQYKLMLNDNLDDYIRNFDKYMNPENKTPKEK